MIKIKKELTQEDLNGIREEPVKLIEEFWPEFSSVKVIGFCDELEALRGFKLCTSISLRMGPTLHSDSQEKLGQSLRFMLELGAWLHSVGRMEITP